MPEEVPILPDPLSPHCDVTGHLDSLVAALYGKLWEKATQVLGHSTLPSPEARGSRSPALSNERHGPRSAHVHRRQLVSLGLSNRRNELIFLHLAGGHT